ncbi:hypothetical protein [Serratia liquefaciens]|uniref:hypothetical protein n=1 Tax=Serratia liquefaciens TaxID=614 RepID=UPI000E0864CA|nr:hypothetical protein [Serratia liquefaciens]RYM84669.1 hypothetical protein BSR02_10485 [Serratia liquefaciens]SUI54345.1 Uncharacterised protein [Serratia liquefaciens]
MNHSLMALMLLALLPATLQAAQRTSHHVASGTIRFIGEITSPACTIQHRNEEIISLCSGLVSAQGQRPITTSLKNMPPELVSNVTTEIINNNDRLKNITISYK